MGSWARVWHRRIWHAARRGRQLLARLLCFSRERSNSNDASQHLPLYVQCTRRKAGEDEREVRLARLCSSQGGILTHLVDPPERHPASLYVLVPRGKVR